ncbi:hypothetical protein RclHR1_00160015 [Rhizophagus clarus]|uniref:Kinase-like domain-containing protein n=1 Tax=Rhizophagus clarus TaxID=94130 RepID=A0A2Z6QU51_9GLOM|nr:hypothetical protein RclHR1_00160015 [Rhizophagus clarus]GES81101.1 kinase-like domain-containing protein [Rhizophagus clarus]
MQNNENIDEWINWIEESINKKHIKYYEYENFKNIQEIGSGTFGKVFRANCAKWKNFDHYLALKSFYNLNSITIKEIINELKLQQDLYFHGNIIRFYGITKIESENKIDQTKNYSLVMEYADGGTLRDYLKNNFDRLTWNDKYYLAYQLAYSVSCLHDEGIVHRNLHSCNVLVHENFIKLADVGLSKRIDEASNSQSKLYSMVPYIDPKVSMNNDNLKLNKKSDIYSIGVLLWEISSGCPPFHKENYDLSLMYKISQGQREEIISNTPDDYSNLYIECWNNEPSKRPNIRETVKRLRTFISNSNSSTIYQQNGTFNPQNNTGNSLYGKLFNMIQKYSHLNISEIDSMSLMNKQINESTPENLRFIINEVIYYIFKEFVKGNEFVKLQVLNYLNDRNVNSKEAYNWLLKNQNNPDFVFLLGYFNYVGIGTNIDEVIAFNLFINASKENHTLAQYFIGYFYQYGRGITRNENLALEYYEKVANKEYAMGQFRLGYYYNKKIINKNGFKLGAYLYKRITGKKDLKMAAHWYEKAANNGHLVAMFNLGNIYRYGIGVNKNRQKAFGLFKLAAEGELSNGIAMLGYCYEHGIGINIDKKEAVGLYQKAADLGLDVAQYNLASMYEKGVGIEKDLDKAIYWYTQSAKQGYQYAQKKLKKLKVKK